MRMLAVVLAALAAAGAVAAANVVLLGYGSERSGRVGKLSPVVRGETTPSLSLPRPAATTTTRSDDHDGARRDLDD
jgi:hypothetical protein